MSPYSKKFLPVAGTTHLPDNDFVEKTKGMAQAEIDNPALVGGLNPDGPAVKALVLALETKIGQREALYLQAIEKTDEINAARAEINDIVSNQWPAQIRTAVGDDIAKIHLLGYKVKGEDEAQGGPSVADSYPVITEVKTNVALQHTLMLMNSKSGKTALPADALHIDVYAWYGEGEPPADLSRLQYLGIASRGKFTKHYSEAEVGKYVYYVTVYVDRKHKHGAELCGKVKCMMT
jgi:hypothetical protein